MAARVSGPGAPRTGQADPYNLRPDQQLFSSGDKSSNPAHKKSVIFQGGRNLVVNKSQSFFNKSASRSKHKMTEYADAVDVNLKYDSNLKKNSTNGSNKKQRSSNKLLKPRGSAETFMNQTLNPGTFGLGSIQPSLNNQDTQKGLNRVLTLNQIKFANNKTTISQKIQVKPHLKSTFQDSSDPQQAIKVAQTAFLTSMAMYLSPGDAFKDVSKLAQCLKQLIKVKKEFSDQNNRPEVFQNASIGAKDPKNRVKELPLLHYLVQYATDQAIVDKLLMPALRSGLNVNVLDSLQENILHVFFKRKGTEWPC